MKYIRVPLVMLTDTDILNLALRAQEADGFATEGFCSEILQALAERGLRIPFADAEGGVIGALHVQVRK